jgi:phenylacetic acid degradation protein paaN
MSEFFDKHRERLECALDAVATRGAWTPFVESPSRKHHPEGAHARGKARFEGLRNSAFPLTLPGERGRIGAEVSPYTLEPLGIDYSDVDLDALYSAMHKAQPSWAGASVEERVGLCLEILDRLAGDVFANCYATMHTAGQAFMMAFAGSGANSLDRGLEALTYAYKAMADVPRQAVFERSFGRKPVRLEKRYRLMPRGIAAVVACGSYPAWNAYPALFANLATGNPVVLKPHPNGILPMAMAVTIARGALEEAGFDPNLVTLAADEPGRPITKELARRDDTAIIDFTGSQSFGAWLEQNCSQALVYTETSGCNAVVVESTSDLDGMLGAITQGLALFSGQMCTSPQNIFVPRGGIETDQGHLSAYDFQRRLVETLDGMLDEPSHAAAICGAVQNPDVQETLDAIADTAGSKRVLRRHRPYDHPEFPDARTLTPLVVAVRAEDELYRREHFGPVGFVIETDDRDHALRRATDDARRHGAIASYAYSADEEFVGTVEDAFWSAGASVGVNLVGQRPINFTAAYSDYHVTGLNPAGNACLTDLAFVTDRFRIVQSKVEVSSESE